MTAIYNPYTLVFLQLARKVSIKRLAFAVVRGVKLIATFIIYDASDLIERFIHFFFSLFTFLICAIPILNRPIVYTIAKINLPSTPAAV